MPFPASCPALVLHLGPCNALETEWLGYAGSAELRDLITEAPELAC